MSESGPFTEQEGGDARATGAQAGEPQVVHLLGANLPADHGLSSLGLLLQLGGSVSAILAFLVGFQLMLTPGWEVGLVQTLVLTAATVTRSLLHRAAGTQLLYGPQPLHGVRRYVVAALLHSLLVAALIATSGSLRAALVIGGALAAWPLLLGGLLRQPRFQRFEAEVPLSEDRGFEGAAVLMTAFGVIGLLSSVASLRVVAGASQAFTGLGALIVLACVLLVARSAVHVRAGISGLRHRPLDEVVERVSAYASLGVISALAVCGVMFLIAVGNVPSLVSLLVIAVTGCLLAVWPITLRRFFADRQFGSFLAGDSAPIHRRAPDAGLTALGWLLIATGAVSVSLALVTWLAAGAREAAAFVGAIWSYASWWAGPLAVAQIFVGYELVRMTPRSRAVATYGSLAILGFHVASNWNAWRYWDALRVEPGSLLRLAATPAPVVLAALTLVLARRHITRRAQVVQRPR
ncbi:MAG: hypothetical protein R3B48_11815 [Kofleriaceae bacterium]